MKKCSVIAAVICLVVLCSGCSGSERMTNLTIVQAIGLDVKDNKINVTLQYLDVNKGSGTSEGLTGNITACAEGSGSTIEKAIKNTGATLPDKLFFDQNKIIVLGKGFIKKKDRELQQFLELMKYSRPDVLMVQSTDTAAAIVKNSQRGSRVPAESLSWQLKRSKAQFNVNDYLNEYRENQLPQMRAGKDYTVIVRN